MKYIQVKKIEDTEWECLVDFEYNPKQVDDDMTLQEAAQLIDTDYCVDVDQIRFYGKNIGIDGTDGRVYTKVKEPIISENISYNISDQGLLMYEQGTYFHPNTNNIKADDLIGTLAKQSEKEEYEFVDSPTHYNSYEKEVIDMMVDIYGKEKVAIFCEINAFKYRMRMGTKPGQDVSRDLDKEKWYLDKKNELKG